MIQDRSQALFRQPMQVRIQNVVRSAVVCVSRPTKPRIQQQQMCMIYISEKAAQQLQELAIAVFLLLVFLDNLVAPASLDSAAISKHALDIAAQELPQMHREESAAQPSR